MPMEQRPTAQLADRASVMTPPSAQPHGEGGGGGVGTAGLQMKGQASSTTGRHNPGSTNKPALLSPLRTLPSVSAGPK